MRRMFFFINDLTEVELPKYCYYFMTVNVFIFDDIVKDFSVLI